MRQNHWPDASGNISSILPPLCLWQPCVACIMVIMSSWPKFYFHSLQDWRIFPPCLLFALWKYWGWKIARWIHFPQMCSKANWRRCTWMETRVNHIEHFDVDGQARTIMMMMMMMMTMLMALSKCYNISNLWLIDWWKL